MEEDTEDKVRRNLVVVSAAVLLGAWLNLPAKSLLDRVLGADASAQVEPVRVWGAVLLLLLYLLLRYRFIGAAPRALQGTKAECHAMREKFAETVLRSEIRRYSKSGKDSPSMQNSLVAAVAANTPDHLKQKTPVVGYTFLQQESPFKGAIGIELLWPGERVGNSSDIPLKFEVRGWNRWLIELKVFARVLLYSKACTEMVLPILLSFSAVVLVVWRLIEATP